MKTAREVIAAEINTRQIYYSADSIIAALAANGYAITRTVSAHFIVFSNGDTVRM